MTGQADFSYLRGSIRGVIIHEACAEGEGGGQNSMIAGKLILIEEIFDYYF